MTYLEIIATAVALYLNGILVGYIIWGKDSPFKQGVIDGITFKFLWRGLVKKPQQ